MIGAVIIDDETHCIERLRGLLETSFAGEIQLMGCFQGAEEGITAIRQLRPGLVFLDVQLGRQSGFDVLRGTEDASFEVIFTTAYEKYAVQAFKFSAIDYLLKPVEAADLAAAVDKVIQKKADQDTARKIDTLLHNVQAGSKKICVPVTNGYVFLAVADIIRCESDVNYTYLFLKDNQRMLVSRTLKEFEDLLSDYHFFRVHNSHLINLDYIKSYNRGKGGFVTMADNCQVEVSSRRRDEFLKLLTRM